MEYKKYSDYVERMKDITKCPVCGREDNKTTISRHIMNCKDEKHKSFVKKQEELT